MLFSRLRRLRPHQLCRRLCRPSAPARPACYNSPRQQSQQAARTETLSGGFKSMATELKREGSTLSRIEELLGEDGRALLEFNLPKISKDVLQTPGPDFVDRV